MVARTRSATSSPTKPTSVVKGASSTNLDPLKFFILPRDLSPEARILSLPHPRDGSRNRFLFCPVQGLFEFTKFSTSNSDPRSILLSGLEKSALTKDYIQPDGMKTIISNNYNISAGYVNKDAEVFIASPFDLCFLLLPLLFSPRRGSQKALFQPLDDLLEVEMQAEKHLKYVYDRGRQMVEDAIPRICDAIDAGDEQMFRLNEEKVMMLLQRKAQDAIDNGLPSSLEEKFITRALEAPVLSIKRQETAVSTVVSNSAKDDVESATDSGESQSSFASTALSTTFSEASSSSSVSDMSPNLSSKIIELQRLRVAFKFITSSYLPSDIALRYQEKLTSDKSILDFGPLDAHLKRLASLQSEAMASRSISDFSRKRSSAEDDDATELRAEKRKKQEEEERRKKASESRGIRDLKKVNVTGMKKMSDFFIKKPSTKVLE